MQPAKEMAFKSSRRAGLQDTRGSQQCPWRSTESQEPQLGALLSAVPWEKGSLEGYYFFFPLFLFLLLFPNLSSEQLRSPASQGPDLFSSTMSLLFKYRHKARLFLFFFLPKDK